MCADESQINQRFNREKSKICIHEVRHLGHILSQDTIKPVTQMEIPENSPALQRFVGMVTC